MLGLRAPDDRGRWYAVLSNRLYCRFPTGNDGAVEALEIHEIVRMKRRGGAKGQEGHLRVENKESIVEILTVIIIIGVLATVGALLTGVVSMVRGDDFDQAHSHQLMFTRVGLQGITLLCLLLALYLVL